MKTKQIYKIFPVILSASITYQVTQLNYLLFNGWKIDRVDSQTDGDGGGVINYGLVGKVDSALPANNTWEDILEKLVAEQR